MNVIDAHLDVPYGKVHLELLQPEELLTLNQVWLGSDEDLGLDSICKQPVASIFNVYSYVFLFLRRAKD